jgi:predicted RNase H-like HicB family nuclease
MWWRRKTMEVRRFKVILEREETGTYTAYVPALPGCHSQGDTEEEAMEHVREAIECHIASLQKDGLPVPEPTDEILREVEVPV